MPLMPKMRKLIFPIGQSGSTICAGCQLKAKNLFLKGEGMSNKNEKTVLVAEDDDAIRSVLKEMLQELGYNAIFARNGEEALLLAKKYEGSLHILLADVVMPGINGCELAERLSHMRPDIKVILMSGYPKTAHPEVETTKAVFVQKPFTINQLAIKLEEALKEH